MTPPVERARRIAVRVPGEATAAECIAAEAIDRLLGERGCTLVRDGLGGAMAAAANAWVDHVMCTGIGQARNAVVAATGEPLIAVGGGFGTLSEIAVGLRPRRPVVLLGGWSAALLTEAERLGSVLLVAATPEEAVARAMVASTTIGGGSS